MPWALVVPHRGKDGCDFTFLLNYIQCVRSSCDKMVRRRGSRRPTGAREQWRAVLRSCFAAAICTTVAMSVPVEARSGVATPIDGTDDISAPEERASVNLDAYTMSDDTADAAPDATARSDPAASFSVAGTWSHVVAALYRSGHEVEQLSRDPDVRLIRHFLSGDECAELVRVHDALAEQSTAQATQAEDAASRAASSPASTTRWCFNEARRPDLERIGIVQSASPAGGDYCTDSARDNEKLFDEQSGLASELSTSVIVPPGHSPAVDRLEVRLARELGLSPRHAWANQLLRYKEDHSYSAHTDCITASKADTDAGADPVEVVPERDRAITVLIYLADVAEGGETAFPALGVDVKPERGSLLLWRNVRDDARCDLRTEHLARRVAYGGPKLAFQKWFDYKPLSIQMGQEAAQNTVYCDEASCRHYIYPPLMQLALGKYEEARQTAGRVSPLDTLDVLIEATVADPHLPQAQLALASQLDFMLARVVEAQASGLEVDVSYIRQRAEKALDILRETAAYFDEQDQRTGTPPREPLEDMRRLMHEAARRLAELKVGG